MSGSQELGRAGGEQLLTASEVGKLLGVPATWVYEQSRCNRIPTVTLGRYRRYRRDAILDWIGRIERGEDTRRS